MPENQSVEEYQAQLLGRIAAQDLALPNTPGSVKFAVIGDSGSGDAGQYQVAQQMTAFHANANHGLGCRVRRTQHSDGGEGFVVKLSNKKRFFRPYLFPNLSNPYVLGHDRHMIRLVRTFVSVNYLPLRAFQSRQATLAAGAHI